ncbi:MAG: acetyl-CoA acetyltransferase [Pseudomonadota bacterium]
MATAPETPVLVGIAQVEQRIDAAGAGDEPFALMLEAVRRAAQDAGAPALLEQAGSVRVIRGIWPYQNPAKAIAEAIGAPSAETGLAPYGGNYVQTTVNRSCLDLQAGTHEVIVIAAAECGNSQAKARRAGMDLQWGTFPGEPDLHIDAHKPMSHEAEKALGIRAPIQVYPLFENALRHHLGEDLKTHRVRISQLWARFSEVAAGNPDAWIQEPVSAESIRTLSASNRPVSFPYPKLMNSNSNVDMGAALILTTERKARALGIARDLWVYPHVGTDAHDTLFVSHRNDLYSSPAIEIAGNRALELAGLEATALDHVDLYSCFPVAVQVAARALGLDQSRALTVTGGLTFGGGPLNSYVMHSIARMGQLLRKDPGSTGLITANGGFLTKHAFGIYSTQPPAQPFQHEDLQAEVDARPARTLDADYEGPVTVESYTVMYDAQGPSEGLLALRTPQDARCWGKTREPDVLKAMTESEFCGRDAQLQAQVATF